MEHGVRSKLYNKWHSMKNRCNNIKSKDYKNYGGRGIRVCEEWLNYSKFREWSLSEGYIEGLTIERINNDKDYEPNNCKWITMKEQQRNKRNNRLITHNNKTLTMVEWGEIYNIHPDRIGSRLKSGWSIEKALTEKVKTPMTKNKIHDLGNMIREYRISNNMTQIELSKKLNVNNALLSRWETGSRYPTIKHIGLIKEILKIEE